MFARSLYVWSAIAGASATALVAVATGVSFAEPYWLTTRDWVRLTIRESNAPLIRAVGDMASQQAMLALSLAHDGRRKLESDIANRKTILSTSPNVPPDIRRFIEDQIEDMTADLERSKREISRLEREAAKR